MMTGLKFILLGLLHIAVAVPILTDLEMVDDTVSVGTYVREVRAAPPDNYERSYESEGDGVIGYSRKKNGGGKKGYQHFDSYHKKAGDDYELETQDSYGLDDEGQAGAHSHKNERKAERYQEPDAEEIDEENPKRQRKPERGHAELREGVSDGNGGIEAYGHDPADYVLPEKYTYGSGEEYNF
ncbi:unnamed protein product [Danaus chrysippus]|uniref:(African queen) hypothetical protein n=1 Tax=Danaus chrysippus TaxID=151541 RepID=A0A8J2VR59_9NEOP|nr:unnamed protein product [Danaus chrysippus]